MLTASFNSQDVPLFKEQDLLVAPFKCTTTAAGVNRARNLANHFLST